MIDRSVVVDARGAPVTGPTLTRTWRFKRSADIPQPFHRALDIALAVVNAEENHK